MMEDIAAAVIAARPGAPLRTRSGCVRLAGLVPQSIVDGPGLRLAVFSQGCSHACPGCQNPHTHAMRGGREYEITGILADFDRNPLLAGITLSGGEPFARPGELWPLAEAVRLRGKDVWCYSGYTFEQILARADRDDDVRDLCAQIDVLVDGRFELRQRTLDLPYRGSANQRLVDMRRSLRAGRVVLHELPEW